MIDRFSAPHFSRTTGTRWFRLIIKYRVLNKAFSEKKKNLVESLPKMQRSTLKAAPLPLSTETSA